jgi:hypothetical protein
MENRPKTLCSICQSHETDRIAENETRHTYICHGCGGIYEVNSQYMEFMLGDPYCSEEAYA